ncbi:hypothetical protein PALS1_080 [Staphylococcus phage PALS_1]|nr:hypothetical protein PALS1_080 [Staphylococcus phage PALS_1]WFG33723.1 hypothetical protein YN120080_6 [Staphylococcus phage vB_SauM_JDYN]
MKLKFNKTDIDINCVVYNSVIEDFGIVVGQGEGYNIMYMNSNSETYDELLESFLIYNKPLTLDELMKDNKTLPEITIE